ncbi:MAG: hypothetical protein JWN38_83 [Candidatus Saccharibacteria bacterium]|nr:hypothetical protein [Candidatus Saccharibacteria bacterium]
MPALGETLRFIEPEPWSEEVLAQHAEIDIATQGLYLRMHELAPEPRDRHWYSTNGVMRSGPKVEYALDDNPNTLMDAWLITTNWRKGYGPSGKRAEADELEVQLATQSKVMSETSRVSKGRKQYRASAGAGKLTVWGNANAFLSVKLKTIPFESATNILTDIGDTLDLIANAQ